MRRHLVNEFEMETNSHLPVLRLSYGFVLDGVQPLRNITKIASVSHPTVRQIRSSSVRGSMIPKYLTIYPDPELYSFDGVKRFYFTRNEYLNLNVSEITADYSKKYTLQGSRVSRIKV